MASIQEIQQQGQGVSLGPVEITKAWPVKGAGAKSSLFLLIKDATGQGALTIWGPASGCNAQVGQKITVQASGPNGGLTNQEFPTGSGKWSINANSCRVTIMDQGSAPQGQYQAPAQQASPPQQQAGGYQQPTQQTPRGQAQPAPACLTTDEMADKIVEFGGKIMERAIAAGFPEEIINRMVGSAAQAGAMWFFGEKYPGKGAGE